MQRMNLKMNENNISVSVNFYECAQYFFDFKFQRQNRGKTSKNLHYDFFIGSPIVR